MRFIIIDGLDGSGKDTQANLIQKKYTENGDSVILRIHPEKDNKYGRKAKKALLGRGKINKIKSSIYYAFDVIRSVRLYYKKADTVIFVRYLVGVAYLPFPLAKILYIIFKRMVPTSEYMFFLDVKPEEAFKRVKTRDNEEIFENLDDLIKVRGKALKLINNWHIINGNHSIEDVQMQINSILDNLDKQNK
ncbi:MAG: thymidylate kinase [Methanobacterium sp.]|uniref:thymidylate kinase n=1 Tax=Methanobacterium sp. TaxID=2164 RepID=UPI003D64BCBC|nr:thymidylate kinase [Methanobacterium sp.]